MLDGTPLLRFYAKRRARLLERQNAVAEQERQLLNLTARAAGTRFGRDHEFSGIRNVADFQARVPLRRYEEMWRDYWQAHYPRLVNVSWPGTIPYFALSSGTSSGTTKYVPVSHEMGRGNARAALDVLVHHVVNRPDSRLLGGTQFLLGGSTDLSSPAPGVYQGDLSGIAAARSPVWARPFLYPPRDIALIADWEKKIEALSRGIVRRDVRSIAGTPSWLLIFFEHLFARHPEREPSLRAFFPNLELVIHGGVNFAPYRRQFERLLADGHAETREVYAASEGFIAGADRGPGEGMRLSSDNGLFFEFVPREELDAAKPTRHWLGNVESGIDYAIAVSTCAGLWAYLIGDLVRFVETVPPRLLVTGRTAYYLSPFGEHLTGEDIDEAVGAACVTLGVTVGDYSVGALFPDAEHARGGHLFIVEFTSAPPDGAGVQRFLHRIDEVLCERNDDYKAHRSGGFGLDCPRLLAVRRGSFEAWMKSRGKQGGQNKVPRVIANDTLFASLKEFCRGRALEL